MKNLPARLPPWSAKAVSDVGRSTCVADSVSGTACTVRGFDGATCETGVTNACCAPASTAAVVRSSSCFAVPACSFFTASQRLRCNSLPMTASFDDVMMSSCVLLQSCSDAPVSHVTHKARGKHSNLCNSRVFADPSQRTCQSDGSRQQGTTAVAFCWTGASGL